MPFNPIHRIEEEIAYWKHCHPKDMVGKVVKLANNVPDLMHWEVGIPGLSDSDWDGGLYRLLVHFPEDYPFLPPKCYFSPPIFHPNVSPSGEVFHPLLRADVGWKKEMTILSVCKAIQTMLEEPLPDYVANPEAFRLYSNCEDEYYAKVASMVKEFPINAMFERYWR